jgi:hypothetical protein
MICCVSSAKSRERWPLPWAECSDQRARATSKAAGGASPSNQSSSWPWQRFCTKAWLALITCAERKRQLHRRSTGMGRLGPEEAGQVRGQLVSISTGRNSRPSRLRRLPERGQQAQPGSADPARWPSVCGSTAASRCTAQSETAVGPHVNGLQSGSRAALGSPRNLCPPRTVHLRAATTPRWLRSARGAVSSTGRAKDF